MGQQFNVSAEMPLVCIAMPAYNAAKTISLAINSILNQTYSNWRLFVFDDGSSDETRDVVSSFQDPRISLCTDKERRGLAARLNQIIDFCSGDFFARLDADDIAYPDRLRKQVEYLLEHPSVDLLGTGALVFKQDGQAEGHYPVRVTHSDLCRHPWSGFYLAHPTWMGKLGWFKMYRYREDMAKAQDQDLLLRSYRRSHFAVLPEILTGYRQETLTLKKIIPGRFHFSKAFVREAWKNSEYLPMFLAPFLQLIKLFVDIFSITTGRIGIIRRHRALPINNEIAREWDKVWLQSQRKDHLIY